ncbi:MAG: polymer-forming cytoskeletal protein [Candidatus Omnitrophota bacterium]
MFKKNNKSMVEGKIVDIETEIQGNVKFNGPLNLRISGNFEGELETKGNLIIGENAFIKATMIRGENINIHGRVKGDIICNRLELSGTARLIGNVETASLVIGEGAVLRGKCQMPAGDEKIDDKESASKKKFEKRPPEETKNEGA